MNARSQSRRIRRGAMLLAVALGIGVGARLAITSQGNRSRRPSLAPRSVVAPARAGADRPERDDDVLATLRARRAAGATLADIAAALVDFGHRDPAKALDFAQWLAQNAVERHDFVAAVLGDWAARQPDAAWRWMIATGTACDLPDTPPLAGEVLAQIAARDPNCAVTLVASLLETNNGTSPLNLAVVADRALRVVIDRAGTDAGWRALREWSAAPAANLLGRDVFKHVASREPPPKAAEQLAALPASLGRNFALSDVVAAWAGSEPRAALAWAQTLPDETRGDTCAAAFARWQDREPLAAAEWLASAPVSPESDRLIAHLVSDPRIVRSDVSAALSLAESVGDPRLRRQSFESIVRRWAEADSAAAVAYVKNQPTLSADDKRDILAALQPETF